MSTIEKYSNKSIILIIDINYIKEIDNLFINYTKLHFKILTFTAPQREKSEKYQRLDYSRGMFFGSLSLNPGSV